MFWHLICHLCRIVVRAHENTNGEADVCSKRIYQERGKARNHRKLFACSTSQSRRALGHVRSRKRDVSDWRYLERLLRGQSFVQLRSHLSRRTEGGELEGDRRRGPNVPASER